jgi:inhibitor of KinA sporulation pathway (predicted exonuclease)
LQYAQETIDKSPTFPEMVQKLEQWLNQHGLLVEGKLREGACWCTDGVSLPELNYLAPRLIRYRKAMGFEGLCKCLKWTWSTPNTH